MFTEKQINEILEVCEKATPGPWVHLSPLADWESNRPGGLPRRIVTTEDREEGQIDILEDISESNADFIALSRTALPQLAEEVIKLRAVAEVAKHFYGICFDMPIDFPVAGPFVWGMGDLKDALIAAGYGGEE